MFLVACTSSSTPPVTFNLPKPNTAVFDTKYSPQAGTPGGVLIVGFKNAVKQLNPFYSSAYATWQAARPVLRGLATTTYDGKFVADLAASIPTVDNKQLVISGNTFTMVVSLKPNLKWSDGQPLTMNDLKYTWQWATDPGQVGCVFCSVGWPLISGIDVSSDGLTATIHWSQLYSGWLTWMVQFILPQHYMSTVPVAHAAKASMPLSAAIKNVPWSGPFVITNATSTEIDYAPNSKWAGGVSADHSPYLSGMKIVAFPSQDGVIAAYKTGSIDLALGVTADQYAAINSAGASIGAPSVGANWYYEQLVVNNDPSKARGNGLWDVRVRQALELAIDKSAILKLLFPGLSVPSLCQPTAASQWYSDTNAKCPAADQGKAKDLLKQAGWSPDSSGIVANGGREMDLTLCTATDDPGRLLTIQKVASDLRAVGIKSEVVTVPLTAIEATYADTDSTSQCSGARGNFDIIDFTPGLPLGDPYGDLYPVYGAKSFPDLGDHSGLNYARYTSSDAEAALTRLKTDVDISGQIKDAYAMQEACVRDVCSISLYTRLFVVGVGGHVGNFPGYSPSFVTPTWNVEDWFRKG